MKKKIILAASLVVLVIIGVVMFFALRHKNSISAVMYYLDKTQTALVADNVSIRFDDPLQIPYNIVEKLQSGKIGTKSPVDERCRINTISFDSSDSITVDLSEEFLSDRPHLNVLRTYAIVKSICSTSQFIGITKVKVTVDNKPITTADGTALSYLSDSSINIMNSGETMTYECQLYFQDRATGALKSETRKIDAANGTVEFNAISALIKGPESRGLKRIFPKGVKLISAETWAGVCYVNFSALPQDIDMEVITLAMTHTLSPFNHIESVKILINGKDPHITQN